MYRFLITPRWFGINLFAVLAVPVCVFMGTWQLGRFEDRVDDHRRAENRPAATSAAIPLADVLGDGGPGHGVNADDTGRAVTASGRYDAAHQQLVPGRDLDGRRGFYVLTPLRTPSGRAVAVVRGWHPGNASAAAAPAPPTGGVTVRGALQQPEGVDDGGAQSTGLPEGQLGIISGSALVNVVPYPVYDGWITLTEADSGLTPVPPAAPRSGGLDMKAFQNLGYTGQWFVFAGFVVFMWFRLLRREVEVQRDVALGLVPESPAEQPTPAAGAAASRG